MSDTAALIRQRFEALAPVLDEQARRRLAAAEARALGRGGVTLVSRVTGIARSTIDRGIAEIEANRSAGEGRVRRPGGGRKSKAQQDPTLLADLAKLLEDATRGDPMSPLLWTSKSLDKLSAALKEMGHEVCPNVVGRLLRKLGYSLQSNRKTREGSNHPDRDAQFRYLDRQMQEHNGFAVAGDLGRYQEKGAGRRLQERRQGTAAEGVTAAGRVHDFVDPEHDRAVPYGVYDIADNKGWGLGGAKLRLDVGVDRDTAAFAVNTIRRWWSTMGRARYRRPKRLMITADGGGSNGTRVRLWKVELQKFVDEIGIPVTVCHLPPGTSKWNKIEHRLFAFITKNWRGKPLVSHRAIVQLIGATTTHAGLQVRAELDSNAYPAGIKVTDAEMASLVIERHAFHGEWNYTLRPRPK